MWFGIPTITNGRPDIAEQLAQGSPRELRSNHLVGTIDRFHGIHYLPVWIAAAVAAAIALLRRNWMVLALAPAWSCGRSSRSRSPTTAGRPCRATCSRPRGSSRSWPAWPSAGCMLEGSRLERGPGLPLVRRGRGRGAGRGHDPGRDPPRARRAHGPDRTSTPAPTRSRCCRARPTRSAARTTSSTAASR